jgi:outer membrane biosynthesis protein TonB
MSIFAKVKAFLARIKEKIRPKKEKDVIIFEEKPIEKPIEKKEIAKEEKIEKKEIEKPKIETKVEKPKVEKPKKKMQVLYIHTFQFYCRDLRYKERRYLHTFKIASKTKSELISIRTRVLNEHHKHFPSHYVEKFEYIKTEVKVIILGKKKKRVIS